MRVVQVKLKPTLKQKAILLDLMRRWSACKRFAYNRLLEGKTRNELKRELQSIFNLNSRFVDDAIAQAKQIIARFKDSEVKLRKIVFGGRKLYNKLHKRHINGPHLKKLKREWKERRQGHLFARGDKSKTGNPNLRIVIKEEGLFLRITLGNRKFMFVKISEGYKQKVSRADILANIANSGNAYAVELKLQNGVIYANITEQEEYPEVKITSDNGVIGLDLNARPANISIVSVNKNGNPINKYRIDMPYISTGNRNKNEYFAWQYAHEVIRIAKREDKAIAAEYLQIKNKGKRGDYSGRKSRRIRHSFNTRILKKIEILAKREGIQVIYVNPAYTSIIGLLKYAPQYMWDKDTAAAYVIARRSLGKKERIPKNYIKILNSDPNNRDALPLDRTSRHSWKVWRVVKKAVVTPLTSDRKVLRNVSILKPILVRGPRGDPQGC